jgi:ESS family glutamate:Na+ symporter
VAYNVAGIDITFATTLRDVLLLVFFVTIGLSAKLSALRAGGRPLAILCGVTVLLLVLQNVTGLLMARLFGAHPFVGLLAAASRSSVARARRSRGRQRRRPWACGARPSWLWPPPRWRWSSAQLVAGPITSWLIRGRGLRGRPAPSRLPGSPPAGRRGGPAHRAARARDARPPAHHRRRRDRQPVERLGVARGLVLPGFLTAMLAGVAITNIADAMGIDLEFAPIERNGEIALQVFLAISLMSLKLWTISYAIPPLLTNVAAQVAVTSAVALLVLFPLLGRDYDAAVAAGGFLGFGLSSMPVAMATMEQVTSRYGPSPRAFLLITLAGSFFVDLANALIVKAFLLLPMFR